MFPPVLDFITRILWSICINLTFRLYLVLLWNWQFVLLSSFFIISCFIIKKICNMMAFWNKSYVQIVPCTSYFANLLIFVPYLTFRLNFAFFLNWQFTHFLRLEKCSLVKCMICFGSTLWCESIICGAIW